MQNKLTKYLIALFLTVAQMCPLGAVAADRQDVRAAIQAANKQFVAALSRGDAGAMSALYGKSAQIFPAHSEIVRGTEAIEQFWKAVINSGIKGVALTTLEVEAHGDTAYEVGTYVMTAGEGKAVDSGKYIVIWKREAGVWKLHRDIWTTNMPAPTR